MLKISMSDLHIRIVSCVSANRKAYWETREPFKVCDQLNESEEVGDYVISCKLNIILELVTDKELAKKMLLTCITPHF